MDVDNVPSCIMLQFFTRSGWWDHRAYWGENKINWGVDGTSSRKRMGDLPALGAGCASRYRSLLLD